MQYIYEIDNLYHTLAMKDDTITFNKSFFRKNTPSKLIIRKKLP